MPKEDLFGHKNLGKAAFSVAAGVQTLGALRNPRGAAAGLAQMLPVGVLVGVGDRLFSKRR